MESTSNVIESENIVTSQDPKNDLKIYTIPFKIPAEFFVEINKLILKCI